MIYDRRGLVAYALSLRQQPSPELSVLIADFAAGTRTQVGAKAAVLLEHLFSKSHVRAERWFSKLTGLARRRQIGQAELMHTCLVDP